MRVDSDINFKSQLTINYVLRTMTTHAYCDQVTTAVSLVGWKEKHLNFIYLGANENKIKHMVQQIFYAYRSGVENQGGGTCFGSLLVLNTLHNSSLSLFLICVAALCGVALLWCNIFLFVQERPLFSFLINEKVELMPH